MPRKQLWKEILALAVGILVVITVVIVFLIPVLHSAQDLIVKDVHEEQTGGTILLHYVVWGKVVNNGTLPSGPVTVTLDIRSPNGAPLFKTDTPIFPADRKDTLKPSQEGYFTFKFTSDDLGGYTGLCKHGKDISITNVSLDRNWTKVQCT
jgi:hypothetical protein